MNTVDELLASANAEFRGRCNWCGNETHKGHMVSCPVTYKLRGGVEWPPPMPKVPLRVRLHDYLERVWYAIRAKEYYP